MDYWIIFGVVTVGFWPRVCGQDTCTWSPTSLEVGRHVVGSDAEYFINSTVALRNFVIYSWTYDGAIVGQHQYSSTTELFTDPNLSARVDANIQKLAEDLVVLSLKITSITNADNGLVLQITRSNCNSGASGGAVTLIIEEECDKTHFEPVASAGNPSTTCAFDCGENFTCNPSTGFSGNFAAVCQADGTWLPNTHACTQTCDNAAFVPTAVPNEAALVGEGSSMQFNCTDCPETFNAVCETGGIWTPVTAPCLSSCDASEVTCGTNTTAAPHCGTVAFQCNSDLVCRSQSFNLVCGSNGQWDTTDCPCSKTCDRLQDAYIAALGLSGIWIVCAVIWWIVQLRICCKSCCSDYKPAECCQPCCEECHDGFMSCCTGCHAMSFCADCQSCCSGCIGVCTTCCTGCRNCCTTCWKWFIEFWQALFCCTCLMFKTAFMARVLAISFVLIVASIVLLVATVGACCSLTGAGWAGVSLGSIAILMLVIFTILSSQGCFIEPKPGPRPPQVGPEPPTNGDHERVELKSNAFA